jgi:hypothetical protein
MDTQTKGFTEAIISRQDRVIVVNKIMNEIANRGRRFFYMDGNFAEIIDKGRIYYKSEWGKVEMVCLSIPDYRKPKGFFHGHTLLCLVREFRDYIKTGEGKKQYSGLYSPYWGYHEEDMEAIRATAKELGYLNS